MSTIVDITDKITTTTQGSWHPASINAIIAERTGQVYLLREVGTGRRKVACEKSCLKSGGKFRSSPGNYLERRRFTSLHVSLFL